PNSLSEFSNDDQDNGALPEPEEANVLISDQVQVQDDYKTIEQEMKQEDSLRQAREDPAPPVEKAPLLPLYELVVLPAMSSSFEVARPGSVAALKEAMASDLTLLLAPQLDLSADWPVPDQIAPIACLAKVTELLEVKNRPAYRVKVEGLSRVKLTDIREAGAEAGYKALYQRLTAQAEPEPDLKLEALRRNLTDAFRQYVMVTGRGSVEVVNSLRQIKSGDKLTDLICSNVDLSYSDQIDQLTEVSLLKRMLKLLQKLQTEIAVAGMQHDIEEKVKQKLDQYQREYYLREQLKVIHDELGDEESSEEESQRYLDQLKKMPFDAKDRDYLEKEIHRLVKYPPNFPEAAVSRSYLDLVFELPWGHCSKDKLNLAACRRQLDRDHYGLQTIKERILEYLAVMKRQKSMKDETYKAPILCLVGPPGVGKTSIAQSIATALGRSYIRMSLGGVKDEAEIRGHRRTYIGAMPGRIIQAIKRAGTDNPLILMDEIDKLGSDYRGDPASALLEVLDPEQNRSFRDHYLELNYDLSQVLFVTTANTTETIPDALLDRMELIELSGYTEEEKTEIARLHLWPKQQKLNGLAAGELRLSKTAIHGIIEDYTREAGVRQLEQQLARIARRWLLKKEEKSGPSAAAPNKLLQRRDLTRYLGKSRYHYDLVDTKDLVGLANGLAWTVNGGDMLNIEVSAVKGSGKLQLTGQLGDVMQESAKVALSYVRGHAAELGLDTSYCEKTDIHIHVPEGAIPKDGPSAGITLAVAALSALSGRPVKHQVAMTGELTIRGRVLPIGGLKEKMIAAQRAGVKTVLFPRQNEADLDDIPASVKDKLQLCPINDAQEAFALALAAAPAGNS
ncbi:MAG: endopeptidase La, partial [Oscillospiraceae bacterium]|nr:endopeptidase La [Oscillospiraceae bacterium]